MLLNDTRTEVKKLLKQDGLSQAAVAVRLGTTRQYVSKVIAQEFIISHTFMTILEAAGYDIRLEYVKRE